MHEVITLPLAFLTVLWAVLIKLTADNRTRAKESELLKFYQNWAELSQKREYEVKQLIKRQNHKAN